MTTECNNLFRTLVILFLALAIKGEVYSVISIIVTWGPTRLQYWQWAPTVLPSLRTLGMLTLFPPSTQGPILESLRIRKQRDSVGAPIIQSRRKKYSKTVICFRARNSKIKRLANSTQSRPPNLSNLHFSQWFSPSALKKCSPLTDISSKAAWAE